MTLNTPQDHFLTQIESAETMTTRLRPFYCTRCGTYHDAITPCPRYEDDLQYSYYYQTYNIDINTRKPLQKLIKDCRHDLSTENDKHLDELNRYENCQIIRPCNYCLPSTPKCVTFNLNKSCESERQSYENKQPCKKYVQDKCTNVSRDTDLCGTEVENQILPNLCDTKLDTINLTQDIETVIKNDQGTDSFDNDYNLFEQFGWCNFHERLHGAGYVYPYGSIQAITEIEETQILEDPAPPGPWTNDGKIYRKKLLKLTYPPHNGEYHKKCKGKYGSRKPVPSWMGWLWNATDECMMGGKYTYPKRPDWRPGAMHYKIARMIKRNRGGYEEIEKPKRKPKKRKREEDEDIRPMIIIMKRQGCYLITMNPIANPYEPNKNVECAPIHFIVDQRKCKIERIKPKPKCDCNCECECDDDNFIESIENLPSSETTDEENDEDEFELEFTPPICLVDHESFLKKQNPKVDMGTQTEVIVPTSKTEKSKGSAKKGKRKSKKAKK